MESRRNIHSFPVYHGTSPQATTINWRGEASPTPNYGQHGSIDAMAYPGQDTQHYWPIDPTGREWNQNSYHVQFPMDAGHGQTISPDEDILQDLFADQDAVENTPVDDLITNSRLAPMAFPGQLNVTMDQRFNDFARHRSAMSDPGTGLPQIVEFSDEESSEQDSEYQTQPTELASNVDYSSQPSGNHCQAAGHAQRRESPFKCPFSPCQEKATGFATTNDLDRHLKSGRHNMPPQKGSGKGYVCSACIAPPDSEVKWWPRLDNFKAHIKRRHREMPVDHLVRMSERDASKRPSNTATEYGDASTYYPGTSVVDRNDNYQHMDTSGTTDSAMTRSYSVQGEHSLWLDGEATLVSTSEQLAGVGKALHVTNTSPRRPFITARTHRPDDQATGLQLSSTTDAAMNGLDLAERSIPRIVLSGPQSIPAKRPADDTWELGTAKRLPEIPTDHIVDMLDDLESEGPFTCRACNKTKQRKCDLKKHQKRHTRPYGCTAPRCYARQGSRSDWKRHEEKQHVVRTSWKCTLTLASGKVCFANFYLGQQFDKHLAQTHRCSQKDVKKHRQAMQLGRDAHGQFWCGFCKDIVPSKPGTNVTAKQYRLAHIGEHFDKDHKIIDDWVCLELNKPHGEIRKEEKRQARADYNKPGSDHGIGELKLDDRNDIAPPSSMVEGKIMVDAPLFNV
nr:hypothetical protein B0A51_06249 [Rachicladosporium sp. CCFEE 5018]